MPLKEDIVKIIEYGTYAPSGDNSQPWRFEVEAGSKIKIFNIPGKDNPILNVRNRGSYIAHGALVENMLIASSQMGFSADLKIFPEGISSDLTATLTLSPSEAKNEPLFKFIKERTTNRKPYKDAPLSGVEKNVLLSSAKHLEGADLKLVEDKKMIQTTAKAMSVTERVALETPELHKLFFGGLIWNEEKNEKGESGLYIKTLEVPPPARFIFKLIKNWNVMKFFNMLGFNKIAAKGNEGIYSSAAAHGAVVVENKDENFINAGRAFQRVWLEATRMGLSVQPVTGTVFMAQRVENHESHPFSAENSELIRESSQKINFAFDIQRGKIPAMTFRVGRADAPSARSHRKKPEIIFK